MSMNKNTPRGFAGLSSLISSVDDIRAEPSIETRSDSNDAASPEPGAAATRLTPPPKPSGLSPLAKWALITVGIVVVIGIFSDGKSGKSSSGYSSSGYSTPSSSTYTPPSTYSTPSYTPPAPSYPSTYEATEEKPPYGNDLVLSANQIRYCLAQGIRLEGWRSVVNQYSDTSVAAFNRAINDYNGRCGQYRYRQNVWSSVNSSVQSERSSLYSEGVRLAIRNP